jgi:hypothetical protein
MNFFSVILSVIVVYGILGLLIYLVVKKINTKLKNRILLPTSDISTYLKQVDEIKEEKARKRWLIIFIINYLSSIFSAFSMWMNMSVSQPLPIKITVLSSYAISFALSFWITYHCAYKKRGSAYLLLLLISIPISIFFLIMSQFSNPSYWSQLTNLTKISVLLNFGLNMLFWISSFNLRKINLVRRYHTNALLLKEKFKNLDS